MTPKEYEAIEKDINDGMKQMLEQLRGFHVALHIAVSRMHPHATSTKNILKGYTKLTEAIQEFSKGVDLGIVVNKKLKE